MNTELSNILGEKLLDGRGSSIYSNGIAHTENYIEYILWENVEAIYVGGTVTTINGIIPGGEDRSLTIQDVNNNHIYFWLTGLIRMKKENRQKFNDIYSFILQKISERQWAKFINKLRNGERLTFLKFEVTKDAFYFHKLFGGFDKKDIACIKGHSIKEGYFYIHYQEPNKKIKVKRVGSVADIPNIHIAQIFINAISKQTYKI